MKKEDSDDIDEDGDDNNNDDDDDLHRNENLEKENSRLLGIHQNSIV